MQSSWIECIASSYQCVSCCSEESKLFVLNLGIQSTHILSSAIFVNNTILLFPKKQSIKKSLSSEKCQLLVL
jgi:hypothetical protein